MSQETSESSLTSFNSFTAWDSTSPLSPKYIYEAQYKQTITGAVVELIIDLGFGICITKPFMILGLPVAANVYRGVIDEELSKADGIYVKSYRVRYPTEAYYGDITYRFGVEWYNLTHTLLSRSC